MKRLKTAALLFLLLLVVMVSGHKDEAFARQTFRPVFGAQGPYAAGRRPLTVRPRIRAFPRQRIPRRRFIPRQRQPVLGGYQRRQRQFKPAGSRVVPASRALRAALRLSPGSRGLGVRYRSGRGVYIVTLKTGNRIHRVTVDARTGQVIDW